MRFKNVRQRVFFSGGFEVEADGELGEFVHLFCLSSFSKFVSATTEQPINGWMINFFEMHLTSVYHQLCCHWLK